jgi:hypothetical protein
MRKYILSLLITLAMATPLSAHPYFIRLGYSSCSVCHVSPQGGGILTAYGSGVERALSLLHEPGQPEQGEEGESHRLLYDMRALVVGSSTNGVRSSSFQLLPSASLKIGAHQRLTSTISITSPTLTAKGGGGAASVTVPIFVWEFQPNDRFELMVGRDTLPTGLGSPDPATFMRTGTDPRSIPYPTQIKAFWRTNRWQLTPYAFGPGGNEAPGAREWGGGVLGGIVLRNQRAVIGVSADGARASTFDRRSVGAYARFGFGKWAIHAEHRVAARTTNLTTGAVVGHTRAIYVPWDWLETWVSTEELVTYTPARTHTVRVAPGMQARLSKNMLIGFMSRDVFTPKGRSRIYSLTLTLKSAN